MYQTNQGPVSPLAGSRPAPETTRAPRSSFIAATDVQAASIPHITVGLPLVAGEVYIDLSNPCRGPFRALHGQLAGSRNRYVPRRAVPVRVWNQIVEQCARLGTLPRSRGGL